MQKSNPKVSIIMPSLNVGNYIEECIQSVINQSLKDIEIICIDAGSTDGTLEIIKKYSKKDNRINLIKTDKKSYGYQVNLGIDAANGDYIGIVETDDFIDKKMYETLYNLTNNGNTDISKVNFYHYYDEDPNNISFRVDESKKGLPKNEFTMFEYPNILEGHPCIWAAIYKKSFLIKNDIKFMEVPGGGWVDNPFLFETLICAKSITFTKEPFYYYRELNPDSSTNSLTDLTLPMRRMLDIFEVLDKYSCYDKNILATFYIRIFWHVMDITSNYNIKKQDDVLFYLSKVLKKLDESIVLTEFPKADQNNYYKYLDDDLNFDNTIKTTNLLIKESIENNTYEKKKSKLFNLKINSIFSRFEYSKLKLDNYNSIKKDFMKVYNSEYCDDICSHLNLRNINKLKLINESLTYDEFILSFENFKLKESNEKISENNKKLKKDINENEKTIKKIFFSKSWKITKPLRNIKN